jgi:transposase
MQSLHRVRDRLVSERTALINQLRAVVLECGFTVPQGRRKLEYALAILLDETDEQSNATALAGAIGTARRLPADVTSGRDMPRDRIR